MCLASADDIRTFEKIVALFAGQDANVTVIAWDRLSVQTKEKVTNNVSYRFIMHGGGYKNWRLIFAKPLWVARLGIYLLRQKPEIIWAAQFDTALPTAIATAFSKIPFIYYIHDNLSISYKFGRTVRWIIEQMDTWIIRRASVVIVPDENRVLSHANKYRAKYRIFPNTPSSMSTPKIIYKDEALPFTIYSTGSLESGRGIETLLKACANFPKCKILMAGRAPEAKVAKAIKESKANIDYRGTLSHYNALELYNEADVIFAFYDPNLEINILASPTKLYESMMMGKPIIVNSETKVSAKVKDWDIGFTCNYGDVQGLENILRSIYADQGDLKQKGVIARKLFESRFDWRLIEMDLWNVVNKVVAEAKH